MNNRAAVALPASTTRNRPRMPLPATSRTSSNIQQGSPTMNRLAITSSAIPGRGAAANGGVSSPVLAPPRSCWDAWVRRKPPAEENRVAHFNHPEASSYGDNYINTSKYSLLSFFPRSLFEQFRRIANVYFLLISVLMLIGTYQPLIFESPLSAYSTLGPLCLVLAITMVKEGAEDYKRHRSDYTVNNRTCPVMQPNGSVAQVPWKDLRVGSVIRVDNKGEVPADVIVLQTSEPRSVCYVETSNIDGETNLKLKEGVAATGAAIASEADAGKLAGVMEYEGPNDRIHTFTGRLQVAGAANFVPVGARNMVLRGCTLRNTHYMLGLVVYSGRDTKVMKKSGSARSKMSQVEKTMNMCIKVIFGAQAVLCTVATIAFALWDAAYGTPQYVYASATSMLIPVWLGDWFSFLILFNNFIPISLYVTVEMVNYGQAWLVDQDARMYDDESGTPAKARTSNLNQDLGQIEYVFSDKTGTLTRNVMEFKQCSVAGRVYGVFVAEADARFDPDAEEPDPADMDSGPLQPCRDCCACLRSSTRRRGAAAASGGGRGGFELARTAVGRAATPSAGSSGSAGGVSSSPTASAPSGFDDPVIMALLRNNGSAGAPLGYGANWSPAVVAAAAAQAAAQEALKGGPGGFPLEDAARGGRAGAVSASTFNPIAPSSSPEAVASLEAFFTCMAVCHTVVPEKDERDPGGPPILQAESPDEAALAKAARDAGFEFTSREADSIVVVRRNGGRAEPLRFGVHGVHEFNSTRKRMSVVVTAPDGRHLLMVKGADNVIFDRALQEPYRAELEGQLTRFASTGLRTLVLAQREMSAAEYASWTEEHALASMALVNREELLAAVAERFETRLSVLGATAIEDRLQDGVPGTIRDLARAGIKTWVLTGDKVETAINIGFSCRLLDPTMELIKVVAEDERSVVTQLALLERKFHPLVHHPETFTQQLWRRTMGGGGGGGASPARTLGDYVLPDPAAAAAAEAALTADGGGGGSGSGGLAGLKLHTNMAVVVTGPALTFIIGNAARERAFLTVARCCRAVIACRVSPQQKANIVKLVRKGISPAPMTLAIGDGANDVGMIQRAEVGVGISGKEGLQAVNSADFAIAQFRFLRRLLLVHGRWDYRRMTKVVLYSFYKNVVITLSLFYFTALTGFSGTSFYESNVYSTYNFVLGLPIIFVGLMDRDVSARTALRHPSVYAVGLRYNDLNLSKILTWIWWAVLHSVITFWLVYGMMGSNSTAATGTEVEVPWGPDGRQDGLDAAGLVQFVVMVWAMQFEVAMQTVSWTWLNYFMIAFSMTVFYAFLLAYAASQSFSAQFYGVATQVLARADYWLVTLLCFGVMAVLDYSVELLRRMNAPSPPDIAMELDRGYGVGGAAWGDEDSAPACSSPGGTPTELPPATTTLQVDAEAAAAAVRARAASSHAERARTSPPVQLSAAPSSRATLGPALGADLGGGATGRSSPRTGGGHRVGAGVSPGPINSVVTLVAPAAHRVGGGANSGRGGGADNGVPSAPSAAGYTDVPRGAVMAGASPAARSAMGVSDARARSGFDYTYVSGKARAQVDAPTPGGQPDDAPSPYVNRDRGDPLPPPPAVEAEAAQFRTRQGFDANNPGPTAAASAYSSAPPAPAIRAVPPPSSSSPKPMPGGRGPGRSGSNPRSGHSRDHAGSGGGGL